MRRRWSLSEGGGDDQHTVNIIAIVTTTIAITITITITTMVRFCMKRIKLVQGRVGREEGAVCVEYSKVILTNWYLQSSLWL